MTTIYLKYFVFRNSTSRLTTLGDLEVSDPSVDSDVIGSGAILNNNAVDVDVITVLSLCSDPPQRNSAALELSNGGNN